jgi:hypothetical protein
MVNVPSISQLKQLVLYLQGVIFPEYYPAVEAQKELILAKRPADETIDGSYYQAGSDRGILNAFEEMAVRSLTEEVMRDEYPGDLETYIKTILNRNV